VFVAEDVSLQLQLDFLDLLATVVGDVNVNVDTRSADPDLTMQTCSNSDDFDAKVVRFGPLVSSSERTG
jgi:hypothetical protein